MPIYRFILRAYPAPNHPKYHQWQKSTLILFIVEESSSDAETRALDEIKNREWVPEAFELRDTLIEERVRNEGGDVWDAYLEAKRKGIFWMEAPDSLPMTLKGKEVWGTGPRLNEDFVDQLIIMSGGHRVTDEEAGQFREKNADYVLDPYVLELKHLEQEGLEVPTRQTKIAGIFDNYVSEGLIQKVDPYRLDDEDFKRYWDIVGVPIRKRVKDASKQVKSTLKRLGKEKFKGGVILLNTGYLTIPHDFLIEIAEKCAAKDTGSISNIIVISSWTITNGFDTVVNYGFHPHETSCPALSKLRDAFWDSVETLMTKMITGELDTSIDMQEPMSPTHFQNKGVAFTFGIPEIQSSFKKNKE